MIVHKGELRFHAFMLSASDAVICGHGVAHVCRKTDGKAGFPYRDVGGLRFAQDLWASVFVTRVLPSLCV